MKEERRGEERREEEQNSLNVETSCMWHVPDGSLAPIL
jgi:hypothetical protein